MGSFWVAPRLQRSVLRHPRGNEHSEISFGAKLRSTTNHIESPHEANMKNDQSCPRCGSPLRNNYCSKCGLFSWREPVDTDTPAKPSDEASAVSAD